MERCALTTGEIPVASADAEALAFTTRDSPPACPKRGYARELDGIVHILTCGSVDDGKSTLVGRLLWDASELPADQREMVRRAAKAAGHPERLDYSLLLDGLAAEREQGITIDVAWRYMDTEKRRFVLIDAPGHEQYTRNMASGASHADAAVMLTDARHGIKTQTRRHAAILRLVGVKHIVLAVNKMDLVDWSEARFRELEREFSEVAAALGFEAAAAIPLSARGGDNVARRSANMGWYKGQTLVSALENIPGRRASASARPFRMPVQTVLRDAQDFRGIAGTVAAGMVKTGDTVIEVTTGLSARVMRIATMDGDLDRACAGMAVALVLDTDIDVARGAVLADASAPPVKTTTVEARIVWLANEAFEPGRPMLFKTATDLAPVAAVEIKSRVDPDTLAMTPATSCSMNALADATLVLGRATSLDTFDEQGETGTFLLVDRLTGATLAAGIVTGASAGAAISALAGPAIRITDHMLRQGLCSDLSNGAGDVLEFKRRAGELARLFELAGVRVEFDALR